MQHIGNCKLHVMYAHEAQARGTFTSESLDTKGYSEAIIVYARAGGAGEMDEVQVQECDTVGGTYTAIEEATMGNAKCLGVDGTPIIQDQSAPNEIFVFYFDLRKRERFLNVYTDNNESSNRWAIYGLLGTPSNLNAVTNANMVLSESTGSEAYVFCRG